MGIRMIGESEPLQDELLLPGCSPLLELASRAQRLIGPLSTRIYSAESREPEDVSCTMPHQGVFTMHFSLKLPDAAWWSVTHVVSHNLQPCAFPL